MDATGVLPAILINGHQYFFISYDYDNNYIFAKTHQKYHRHSNCWGIWWRIHQVG